MGCDDKLFSVGVPWLAEDTFEPLIWGAPASRSGTLGGLFSSNGPVALGKGAMVFGGAFCDPMRRLLGLVALSASVCLEGFCDSGGVVAFCDEAVVSTAARCGPMLKLLGIVAA